MSWLTAFLAQVDDRPAPATADRHPELDRLPDYSSQAPVCPLCTIQGHSAQMCQMYPCALPAAAVTESGCTVCSFPAEWHDDEESAA